VPSTKSSRCPLPQILPIAHEHNAGFREALGKALLEACIGKAFANGLTRNELEVCADNANAIALYRRLGFVEEGLKRQARVFEGRSQDLLLVALLREGD
jgi:RimJ/RimL family protein N-acetyltransferase